MEEEQKFYTIILRHDSSTQWMINNPVLALGEYAVEDDTHRVKRGDGLTVWAALPYEEFGLQYMITYENLKGDPTDNEKLSDAFFTKIDKATFSDVNSNVVSGITLTYGDESLCTITRINKDVNTAATVTDRLVIQSPDNSIQGFWSIDEFGVKTLKLTSESTIDDYTPGMKYNIGHIIFHDAKLYRANASFMAPDEFDPGYWDAISSMDSDDIAYDSKISGLTAKTVEKAIDELYGLDSDKVVKTRRPYRVYGTNEDGDQFLYDKDELRTVDTVNGVEADEDKNIQIDAKQINYDDSDLEPKTIKQAIDSKVDKNVAGSGNKIVRQADIGYDEDNGALVLTQTLMSLEDGAVEQKVQEINVGSDAEIQKAKQELNDRIDDEVETLNTTITEKETTINTRINTEVQTLNDRINTEVQTLNDKIDTEVDTLNETIDDEVETLNTKIDENDQAINTRVDNLDSKVETYKTELDTTIQENKEDIESKLAQESATINDRIDTEVETLNTTISNNKTDIETKLANKATEINTRIDEEVTTLNETIDTLETKVDDNKTELDNTIADLTQTVADNKTDIETKLDNTNTTLNTKINQAVNTLNNTINHQVDVINDRIDDEVSDLNATIEGNYNTLDEKIDQTADTAQSNLEAEAQRLDTKIDEGLNTKIDKSLTDKLVTEVEVATESGSKLNEPTLKITSKNPNTTSTTIHHLHFKEAGSLEITAQNDHILFDVTTLDNLVAGTDEKVNQHTTQIGALRTDINNIITHDSQQDTQLANHSTQIAAVQAESAAVQTRMTIAETEITGIKTTNAEQEAHLTRLDQVTTENTNNIRANADAIVETNRNVSKNADDIQNLKDDKADKVFASATDDMVVGKLERKNVANGTILELQQTNVSPVDGTTTSQTIKIISSDNTVVATQQPDGTIDIATNLDTDVNYFMTSEVLSEEIAAETIIPISSLTPTDKPDPEIQDIVTDEDGTWARIKEISNVNQTVTAVTFSKRAQGVWGQIKGDITHQQDLQRQFTTLETDITTALNAAKTELNTAISNEATARTNADNTLQNNIDAEELARTNADNVLDTAKVDKVSGANQIYGTDENGEQTSYNKDSFGKVDTVNNVTPDANKNVTLVASDINTSRNNTIQEELNESFKDLVIGANQNHLVIQVTKNNGNLQEDSIGNEYSDIQYQYYDPGIDNTIIEKVNTENVDVDTTNTELTATKLGAIIRELSTTIANLQARLDAEVKVLPYTQGTLFRANDFVFINNGDIMYMAKVKENYSSDITQSSQLDGFRLDVMDNKLIRVGIPAEMESHEEEPTLTYTIQLFNNDGEGINLNNIGYTISFNPESTTDVYYPTTVSGNSASFVVPESTSMTGSLHVEVNDNYHTYEDSIQLSTDTPYDVTLDYDTVDYMLRWTDISETSGQENTIQYYTKRDSSYPQQFFHKIVVSNNSSTNMDLTISTEDEYLTVNGTYLYNNPVTVHVSNNVEILEENQSTDVWSDTAVRNHLLFGWSSAEPEDASDAYSALNEVLGDTDEYEGMGGTEEEVEAVLDEILGN